MRLHPNTLAVVAMLASVLAIIKSPAPASPADAPTPQPNPKLAAIAPNTWERVADFPPVSGGILSYSGGVYDSVHRRLLIFGGGHADYWGNEVWAFDPASLTWRRMYEPDAQSRYTADNIDNLRGKLKDSDKPYTRHTYNQLCFVDSAASMFIFGGCGPGWSGIHPVCPVPHDCWSYSYATNQWSQLYAGPDTPNGYAMACCYDSKHDVIWAYGHDSRLSRFDLATRTWSAHLVKPAIDYLGTYNYHMIYLPKSDRILIVGKDTCTIDPTKFTSQRHHLDDASGKAGLAYLPDHDAVLYVSLPGGETGDAYHVRLFDCADHQWRDITTQGLTARGSVWSRLQYDAVDHVALLVVHSGVWAYKPPNSFR